MTELVKKFLSEYQDKQKVSFAYYILDITALKIILITMIAILFNQENTSIILLILIGTLLVNYNYFYDTTIEYLNDIFLIKQFNIYIKGYNDDE